MYMHCTLYIMCTVHTCVYMYSTMLNTCMQFTAWDCLISPWQLAYTHGIEHSMYNGGPCSMHVHVHHVLVHTWRTNISGIPTAWHSMCNYHTPLSCLSFYSAFHNKFALQYCSASAGAPYLWYAVYSDMSGKWNAQCIQNPGVRITKWFKVRDGNLFGCHGIPCLRVYAH